VALGHDGREALIPEIPVGGRVMKEADALEKFGQRKFGAKER
jgi:hypothetical protein